MCILQSFATDAGRSAHLTHGHGETENKKPQITVAQCAHENAFEISWNVCVYRRLHSLKTNQFVRGVFFFVRLCRNVRRFVVHLENAVSHTMIRCGPRSKCAHVQLASHFVSSIQRFFFFFLFWRVHTDMRQPPPSHKYPTEKCPLKNINYGHNLSRVKMEGREKKNQEK